MSNNTEAKIKKVIEAANQAKTTPDWGEDAENFHEVMTPDLAIELIAALEQSQQYAKQRDEENQDLMLTIGRLRVEREQLEVRPLAVPAEEELPDLYMSEYHESVGWNDANREVRRMNAEASPLAVKLHKRSVGEVMHMSGFSRDYAEGWCAGNDNAIHEIRAAGGEVINE